MGFNLGFKGLNAQISERSKLCWECDLAFFLSYRLCECYLQITLETACLLLSSLTLLSPSIIRTMCSLNYSRILHCVSGQILPDVSKYLVTGCLTPKKIFLSSETSGLFNQRKSAAREFPAKLL